MQKSVIFVSEKKVFVKQSTSCYIKSAITRRAYKRQQRMLGDYTTSYFQAETESYCATWE